MSEKHLSKRRLTLNPDRRDRASDPSWRESSSRTPDGSSRDTLIGPFITTSI
jgi:hypothetical protein